MQWRVRDGKGAKGRVLPLSERLPQELLNYWRAQRQGKAGHDSPWLFLGKKAGQSMSTYAGQNIYYSALKKSGVRYKGGIHTLRCYGQPCIPKSLLAIVCTPSLTVLSPYTEQR